MNDAGQETDAGSSAKLPALFGSRTNLLLGITSAVLVALYSVAFLIRPERRFADDSFFYFQVAWNIARGMGSTFNNVMPTNGYHPLWMLICTVVYKIIPDRPHGIFGVAAVIVILNVLALATVRRILALTGANFWPVSWVILIPFLFLSQIGTEVSLSVWMLALMMLSAYRFAVEPTAARAFFFNLAAALAVLSRLDNVFVMSFVWLAVTIAVWNRNRWLQIAMLLVYLALWGPYLLSNRIYFHTWQPISGLLKSHPAPMDHMLGANLAHTGEAAFVLIVLSGVILWGLQRRDLFFRTIEVPFAAGVLCHGLYIVFRMSDETRWSWYYASWVLLAAVMTGRAASLLLERRMKWAQPFAAMCMLLLAALLVRNRPGSSDIRRGQVASFNEVVLKQHGIQRVFAYDQPGRLAYYSDVEVIPLDGLMGDLQFQRDLASMGVDEYMRVKHIGGLVGPAVPLSQFDDNALCHHQLYLGSSRFYCVPATSAPGVRLSAVDIYSRVPSVMAGTIPLSDSDIIWTRDGYVSVWKLSPR